MSLIALVCRHRASQSAVSTEVKNTPFLTTRTRNAGIRAKSTHISDKAQRQSFRSKVRTGDLANQVRRDKFPELFRPLPTTQLTHELFQSHGETLEFPVFCADAVKGQKAGHALQFPMDGKDPIEVWGIPKNLGLEFRMLSKPCSVVRAVTRNIVDMLDEASLKCSLENRVVISGRPGCGKSVLLLQAVEYCSSSNWIVLYIPQAINLVNSTTNYAYDLRTQTYFQPTAAFQTLGRLLAANSTIFNSLHTRNELALEKRPPVLAGTPIVDLINVGIKEPSMSPIILTALMEELGIQTEYPVLLAVDDFQALYRSTAYRDPHFVPIQPHHLSMPRLILEYASGKKSFARGAVVGALSTAQTEYRIPVELAETLGLEYDRPTGPWTKRSSDITEYTKGLRTFPVPEKLTVEEAAAIFEVWTKDKATPSLANDEMFLSKYTEASGNARDFTMKGILSTLGGT